MNKFFLYILSFLYFAFGFYYCSILTLEFWQEGHPQSAVELAFLAAAFASYCAIMSGIKARSLWLKGRC